VVAVTRSGRGVLRRRLLDTLGSPTTITLLATLVSIGLGAALVTSTRTEGERQASAERSAALSEISGTTIGLVAALQAERTLANVRVTTRDPTDQARYEDVFDVTDRRVDDRVAVAERHQEVLGDAAPPGDAATLAALASLDSVRATILRDEAEDSDQLYADVIGPVRDGLVDQVFLSPSPEQARLRRGMTDLLTAMEAAGRRANLVATMITESRALTQDDLVQLLILERDFVARVETAAAVTASVPPTESGVDLGQATSDLLTSQSTTEVREVLDQVAAELGSITTAAWLETSKNQIDDIVRLVSALNDEVTRRVESDAASARQRRIERAWLFGALFAMSLIAGASAIVASRDRTRALKEHRALLVGVRRWFQRESLPDVPGIEYEVRYDPAAEHTDAGGDWYDVILRPDGGILIAIGDVAGHGPDTVSHVAELRNILRGVAQATSLETARILETVDATAKSGRFATIFLAHVSSDHSRLTYSRGGHLPAILRRADGTTELLMGTPDLPMGVDPSVQRHQEVTALRPGDALVLFTDGLIEHRDAHLPNEIERMRHIVADAEGGPSDLADQMEAHRTPWSRDDSSLLVVRRNGGSAMGDSGSPVRRGRSRPDPSVAAGAAQGSGE